MPTIVDGAGERKVEHYTKGSALYRQLQVTALLSGVLISGCNLWSEDVAWKPANAAQFDRVVLPKVDRVNAKTSGLFQRIAVLPACDSCALDALPKGSVKSLPSKAEIIVVYDTKPAALKKYPDLLNIGCPVLYEPLPDAIPTQLALLAPTIVVLDKEGRVTRFETFR